MNSPQFKEALEMLRKAPCKVEVLKLLLAGQTNDEIARFRGRAEGTVRKQISNVYKDFGIKSEFPGDRVLRDKLKDLFLKYKPEWVSNCSPAITNEANNQSEKINYDGVTSLALSGDEILEESGEELMFLAINILEALGFEQKFKMNKASQDVGYRLKNLENGSNPYQLILSKQKENLSISIPLDILEPHLLNLKYWEYTDVLEDIDLFIKGRFWVLPSKKEIFLESLHLNYWQILQVEGKTVGDCCINTRRYKKDPPIDIISFAMNGYKEYERRYIAVSSITLEEFNPETLSDANAYLVVNSDERFDDKWNMWKVSINLKEVLQDFLSYFGQILMDKH
ncbi:MAG: helix-turn-helix transcriptional regulator [Nostoc sp.]|uniref:helix-turn-helix domain-containing protein n=1 Tax=Nostoc sp. TaxID=1180 RepID=UPI002FF7DAA1